MPHSELTSHDPVTGAIVWQGAVTDVVGVDTAVARARGGFALWSATPLATRIDIVKRFAKLANEGSDDFANLLSRETGKPLWEARTEVASVVGKVAISLEAYMQRTGVSTNAVGDGQQTLHHRPHGVLAVLGPYNFPAHLPNGHIVPALLAGNSVLFKPSEWTPATALHIASLWAAAGLPEAVLTIVIGDADTGRALSRHDGIDGLLFTGSAHTGAALHAAFAGQPHKMLALEMGGNNPLIAWDVDDVAAAAGLIVQSAYQTAGQRCTCARRLIVEQGPRGEALVEAIIALADRLVIGGPFDEPTPFMGPVIGNSIADKLLAQAGQLEGRVLRSLKRLTDEKPFLTPALVDVSTASHRADDEIFGPLLQLIRVPDFAAALREANHTRFGLAAGLIGGDAALFERFSAEARAGIVNWNRPLTGASSAAPFGGIGLSGNHRPSAYYAADYCAYPVAGLTSATLAAPTLTGIRP